MKILITDLQPGKNYNLQLRSKSGARVSAWSKTFRLPVPFDHVAPAVPTGLAVDVVGDSFLARWDEVTKDEDGTDIADFSHYVIRMRSIKTDETHELMTGRETKFELTYNLNVGLFQEPAGIIEFSVAAVDNSWNSSDFCDPVIGSNPAPNPVRNLVAKGIMEGITASWDPPEPMEDDFLEYRAYIVLGAEEEIEGLNPTWSGNATSFTYSTLTMIDQYVKVVAVDKFGSASTVETAGPVQPRSPNIVDIDAPAIPTDVAGTITGDKMTVTWTPPPNPDNDLAGYTVQYRPVGGGTVGWFMQDATHEDSAVDITVKEFVDYQVRVSAYDFSFNRSGYSAIVIVEGETNLPPAKVTGVEMRAAMTTAMVFWSANTEPDIKGYEVQFERQTPVDTDEVREVTGTMTSFSEQVDDEIPFYARVRAVDNAGLKGEWSDVVTDSMGFPAWVGEWVAETGLELETRLNDAEENFQIVEGRLEDAENALKNADGELVAAGEWIEITGAQLGTNLAAAQDILDAAFPSGPINVTQLIKSSVIQYAVNSSETVAPTTGWSTSTPTRTPGTFIWFRTLITYANNTTTTSSPALLTGNAGAPGGPGGPGPQGVGITSVTPYFQQKAGAAPAKPTTLNPVAAWTTTEPNWVSGQSLYRTERIVYTSGTFAWTDVSKIASYEGIDAAMAAANGKNKVTYTNNVALPGPGTAPTAASGLGRTVGDTHRNRTTNGVVVGRWTWNGLTWDQETLASGVMDSLDVGKITGGSAAFETFVAQNLTANTGIINDLWTKVVRSRKITTDMLLVGQGENHIVDSYFQDEALNTERAAVSGIVGTWGYNESANSTYFGGAQPASASLFYFVNDTRANAGPAWSARSMYVPVEEGEQWKFRARVNVNGGVRLRFRILYRDGTQGFSDTPFPPYETFSAGIRFVEREFTVPANAVGVIPTVQFNVDVSNGWIHSGSTMSRMTDSSLIVDGAVTAKKITITGDENNPDEAGLVANIASIMQLGVENLIVSGVGQMKVGVIDELWTKVVRSRKITTDMMIIGKGENLFPDPYFQDFASWTSNYSNAANDSTAPGGSRYALLPYAGQTGTYYGNINSRPVKLRPGSKIKVSYSGKRGGTAPHPELLYVYMRGERADGTTVSWSGTIPAPTTFSYEYYEGEFDVPAAMVGPCNVGIYRNGTTHTSSTTYVADVSMITMGDASLIVDGGIKARNIDVGDLVADAAFITRIKSDFIDTALIDADQIIAGAGIINDLLIKANLVVSTGGVVKSTNYSSSAGWQLTNNSLVINQGSISARALKLQVGQNSMPAAYANFEFPPSFYSLSTINATTEITDAGSKYGNQCLAIKAPVTGVTRVRLTNASELRHNISVQEGETYILSLWAKGGVLANSFRFLPEYDGATSPTLTYNTVPALSDWTRYSQTIVIPAGVSQMFLSLYMNTGTINREFYIDGVQVEAQTGSSTEPSVWTPGSAFTAIDGGMIRTGEIRSNVLVSDGVSSTQPAWSLNANGGMQVGSAVVRGSLVVGTSSLSNTSFMQSGVFTASSGWRINADGSAEFRKITVGSNQIDPDSISGGTITSPLVVGSTIRTSSNNQRAQMDSIGFRYFNSSNVAVFSATGGSVTLKGEVITSTTSNDGIAIKPDSSRLNNGIIEFLSTRTVNPYIAMEAGVTGTNSQLVIKGPKQGTGVGARAGIDLTWNTNNTSSVNIESGSFGVGANNASITGYATGGSKTSPHVALQGGHITLKHDMNSIDTNVYIMGNLHVDGNFNGTMDTYTPVLTASGTNPTGWTRTGRYKRVGQWVWVDITCRATSSVTAGSGPYSISLPVAARTTTGATTGQIISGHIATPSAEYAIIGKLEGGTSIQRMWTGNNLQVASGRGFAADGSINLNGWYEAA